MINNGFYLFLCSISQSLYLQQRLPGTFGTLSMCWELSSSGVPPPSGRKKTTLTSQPALQVCTGRCPISHWVYMRHTLQCEQRALWNPFCFRVWELQTTQDLPPEQRWQCMLVTGGATKSWQLLKVDTSSLVSA